MKITKNVLVCSNEDCSIPICFECSEKLKSDSKCCPNRCSGDGIILQVTKLIKPLRLMIEDIDFICKYFGCDS